MREVREAWELDDPGLEGGFDDGLPLTIVPPLGVLPDWLRAVAPKQI